MFMLQRNNISHHHLLLVCLCLFNSPKNAAASASTDSVGIPIPLSLFLSLSAALSSLISIGTHRALRAHSLQQSPPKPKLTAEEKQKVDACYDRLTNPKNFHGMYKARFAEKGLVEPAPETAPEAFFFFFK
jgi:hypothetical protein